eukprot:Filipodium_phascolosomae@DN2098_c0_g1_i1.p1
MIDGLGVVGWGVGGIEAEAVMLGQPISMVLPEVIGFKLTGQLSAQASATDMVLTITRMLREKGVVGKFVEFYGDGCASLSIADRATVANMSPEYGATMGYFPMDSETMEYFRLTNRDRAKVELMEEYLKEQGLFRDFRDSSTDPSFSDVVHLDLGSIEPSVAGPKRPQDLVPLKILKQDFQQGLIAPVGHKGYGVPPEKKDEYVEFQYNNENYRLKHGTVVIAAITSCTNTSNPAVMLGAGMLAQNALQKGLKVAPFIKTSLSPGSGVVMEYLRKASLLDALEKCGFYLAGFGCQTCIGNSGELDACIVEALNKADLNVAAVLSGNRNFEGRVHPSTKANYLASPPLVVAFALAGRVDINFENEPIGIGNDGKDVFLRDIWPSLKDVKSMEQQVVKPEMFKMVYDAIGQGGGPEWQKMESKKSELYAWNPASTYIRHPPFFESTEKDPSPVKAIHEAYCLLLVGDSITTDHISPAGKIAGNSPAAKYLQEHGVNPKDFNSYGARRGNDEVMSRGTFANIRLINKMAKKTGGYTVHVPTKTELSVYDAAMQYKKDGYSVIIIAGKEYGCGSSRDWAAKGPALQGVRAVIAESFERIHRSNLVGMGILPLQFKFGENSSSLRLTGHEQYNIEIPIAMKVNEDIEVTTKCGKTFMTTSRVDTAPELSYFNHGGILNYVLRRML